MRLKRYSTSPLQVNQFLPLRFTFSSTVGAITFAFGDVGGDDYTPVTIQAFSGSDILLGTMTDTCPAGFGAGKTLSGNFAGTKYFILSSGTLGNNKDSILWEVQAVIPSGLQSPSQPLWCSSGPD